MKRIKYIGEVLFIAVLAAIGALNYAEVILCPGGQPLYYYYIAVE